MQCTLHTLNGNETRRHSGADGSDQVSQFAGSSAGLASTSVVAAMLGRSLELAISTMIATSKQVRVAGRSARSKVVVESTMGVVLMLWLIFLRFRCST